MSKPEKMMAELLMFTTYTTRIHPKGTTGVLAAVAFLSDWQGKFETTYQQISEMCGVTERTARRHINALVSNGDIIPLPNRPPWGVKRFRFSQFYLDYAAAHIPQYPNNLYPDEPEPKYSESNRTPLPQAIRDMIHNKYNHTCVYCGAPSEHVDHVLPVSKGGTNDLDNLVAACAACNLTKSDRLLSELGWTIGGS